MICFIQEEKAAVQWLECPFNGGRKPETIIALACCLPATLMYAYSDSMLTNLLRFDKQNVQQSHMPWKLKFDGMQHSEQQRMFCS